MKQVGARLRIIALYGSLAMCSLTSAGWAQGTSGPSLEQQIRELAPQGLATASAELRARADRALIIARKLQNGATPQGLDAADRMALQALTNGAVVRQNSSSLTASLLGDVAQSLHQSADEVDAEYDKLARVPTPRVLSELQAFAKATPSVSVFGPKAGDTIDAGTNGPVPLLGGPGAGITNAYPEVALLLHRPNDGGPASPWCSGTLVSPDMIASAAHCVCFDEGTKAMLPGGKCHDIRSVDPHSWLVFFQHAGFSTVKSIIPNRKFAIGEHTLTDDGAVLLLDKPVVGINPSNLPAGKVFNEGGTAEIIGFGESFDGQGVLGTTDPGLKRVGFVTLAPCPSKYAPAASQSFCWVGKGAKDSVAACHGDSGGPIEVDLQGWTILGITSFTDLADDCPSVGDYADMSLEAGDMPNFFKSPDGTVHIPWPPANPTDAPPYDILEGHGVYNLGTAGAAQFTLPIANTDAWSRLVISVNSAIPWTGATRPLTVSVKTASGSYACKMDGGGSAVPSAASCTITRPASGQTLSVTVSGSRKEWIQAVAAAY